jgi:hypothetical protein
MHEIVSDLITAQVVHTFSLIYVQTFHNRMASEPRQRYVE